MQYEIDTEKLYALMKSFFTLTGIRMALIDTNYHEILAYPETFAELCAFLRAQPECYAKCEASDIHAFEHCQKTNKPYIYRCHAGLTEAACVLRHNSIIVGYIMFGQITNISNKTDFLRCISERCADYHLQNFDISNYANNLIHKSDEELRAAMYIFEICVSYIIQNQLVYRKSDYIITKLQKYVDSNLSSKLDVCSIADALYISRTKLYSVVKQKLGIGIAEYVKKRRIDRAVDLLSNTSLNISDIAESVGFTDICYFRRVLHHETGTSIKSLRSCNDK